MSPAKSPAIRTLEIKKDSIKPIYGDTEESQGFEFYKIDSEGEKK
jgi:hypothetical protein